MTNCKICKSENVSTSTEVESIAYKENELQVPITFSNCNNCGREFIAKSQIQANEAVVRAAKKVVDGLMSATAIVRAREALCLTQEQASKVFGGGRNAFSKYERGEVAQSLAMDRLIRTCLKHRHVFRELAREAGIEIQSPQIRVESNVVPYSKVMLEKRTRYHSTKSVRVKEACYG